MIVVPSGRSCDRQLDDAQVLLVGQRRGLAGRAADDEAVGAVVGQVVQQVDERLLVDVQVVVERRDDRGEDGSQPGHVRHCPRMLSGHRRVGLAGAPWRRRPSTLR